MEKIFKNKVALITGGNSGIGRATAIAFAQRGARVIIADVTENKNTLESIQAINEDAIFIKCDVSHSTEVKMMFDKISSEFGMLHFAFNNAGIEGVTASTHECTEDNWDRVLGVNLKSVWLCMKYEIPLMISHGFGAIVNCSSVAGLIGFPGASPYVASKHGIIGLTKSAALENAKTGIRINAVCPGVIRTPMIDRATGQKEEVEKQFEQMEPMGRMGFPEEVAEAVIWLCSEGSSFVTGHAMPVDGGWTAK